MRVNMHKKEFEAIKRSEYERGRESVLRQRPPGPIATGIGASAFALTIYFIIWLILQ